ncbi:MAG TPA: hypothetical protein VIG64_09375, partial [Actinomycetota bacterium]
TNQAGRSHHRDGVFTAPLIASSSLAGRVELVITHGGIGTVGTFAAGGTPLLIVPTEIDQATMAIHAERAGLGCAYGMERWLRSPSLGRRLPSIDPDRLVEAMRRAVKRETRAPVLTRAIGGDQVAELALSMNRPSRSSERAPSGAVH